jgi:hypothetical protein
MASRVASTTRRWVDPLLGVLAWACSLFVYSVTLTPSLSFKSPDGNELATVAYQLGLAHSTGYPLYTWLGKLFTFIPLGDVAHRVNLMSAVLGAGAVALLYGILVILTERRLPSFITALFFAFSLTFWSQTGIAEVYAPNAFWVALTLLLLLLWARREQAEVDGGRQRWSSRSLLLLLLFSLAFGLSLGTHMSNLGFLPAFALFILLVNWRVVLQPLKLLGGALLFLLGCAQFLWLPYKAATLVDAPMARNAPNTLKGFYNYTLGAFPQMKFAFPLWALPDRVVVYLQLLSQNFGVLGTLLGLFGMWEMLFRRTRRFYLLMTMYVVHLVFFTQYRVFDLDVFFIPAHLIYAIFIGYGLFRVLEYIYSGLGHVGVPRLAVSGVAAALLLLLPIRQLRANWHVDDYSDDVAINDFYYNVFQLLPEGSTIVGRGGVFGYDMFYFRYVYDVRPDVQMPMSEGVGAFAQRPLRQATAVYSTVAATAQGFQAAGPWAPAAGLTGFGRWSVPILVGQSAQASFNQMRGSLVLYELSTTAPELVVAEADPEQEVGTRLNGLELVGYDLDNRQVERGGRIHLTLYWRVVDRVSSVVVTAIDGVQLERHELGFGNLARYAGGSSPQMDSIVVEDYWLVMPSTLDLGARVFQVGVTTSLAGAEEEAELLDLATLDVVEGGYFSSPYYGWTIQRR